MMLFTYNITIKHATFLYVINRIRKLVRLAQLVEQWTGNPEAGVSSPQSTHQFSDDYRTLTDFLY